MKTVKKIKMPNGEELQLGGGGGSVIFDTKLTDHILTFEESEGWALQGTYVYKEAVAGSRYGYPDFYNKCVEEFENADALPWKQPKITSNGVMGGGSFAVEASYEFANQPAWQAFDGSDNTTYGSNRNNTPFWVTFYEPLSLKVSSLKLLGRTDVAITNANIEIQACDDNETWETLTSLTQTIVANGAIEIPVNSTNYYKYYRINFVSFSMPTTEYNCNIREVVITATTKAIRQNSNGHLFYDIADKAQIDELYNTNGIAWYYGIDKENERIFLPRTKYCAFTGGVMGNGKPMQLIGVSANLPSDEGALHSSFPGAVSFNTGTRNDYLSVIPDPTKSGITLETDDSKYLYICVGNTNVESAVTDVVDVTTTENDTVPLGYSTYQNGIQPNTSWLKSQGQWNDGNLYLTFYNWAVNELGKSFASGYVKEVTDEYDDYDLVINQTDMTFRLPLLDGSEDLLSDDKVNLTLPATSGQQYTAQYNGVVQFDGATNSSNQFIKIKNNTTGQTFVPRCPTSGSGIAGFVDVRKGDIVEISADNISTVTALYLIKAQGNGSLFYKVANAVQNLELLDAGEVLENLADKISRQDCKAYVTETYQNGASWYRVYSDGWCEQGGFSTNTCGTKTLMKTMSNNTYTCICVHNGSTAKGEGVVHAYNKTTKSFSYGLSIDANGMAYSSWYVCGYIA